MGKDSKRGAETLRASAALLLISVGAAVLLGLIYHFTAAKITQNSLGAIGAEIQQLLPNAQVTRKIAIDDPNGIVKTMYDCGPGQGCCVEVQEVDTHGAIDLLVGIHADGTVAGVEILSMKSAEWLGDKTVAFTAQYQGAASDGSLALTADGGTIQAMSGATLTSRAITEGVNAACKCAASMAQGGSMS